MGDGYFIFWRIFILHDVHMIDSETYFVLALIGMVLTFMAMLFAGTMLESFQWWQRLIMGGGALIISFLIGAIFGRLTK